MIDGYTIFDWRYSKNKNEHSAVNKKRIKHLFNCSKDTQYIKSINGALVPPVGRFLSQYFPFSYFLIQTIFPFLVGQKATVLKKMT